MLDSFQCLRRIPNFLSFVPIMCSVGDLGGHGKILIWDSSNLLELLNVWKDTVFHHLINVTLGIPCASDEHQDLVHTHLGKKSNITTFPTFLSDPHACFSAFTNG
ncbi:hypothetical protein Trydic_g1549 [Trypoxylus dichotomus]